MKNILVICLVMGIAGCGTKIKSPSTRGITDIELKTDSTHYAVGFTISRNRHFTYMVVNNPWSPGDTLASYIITEDGCPDSLPEATYVLRKMPGSIASLSATCLGMLKSLGKLNLVTAATDTKLIYDSTLCHRLHEGSLIDLGEASHINAEAIIAQAPDLVLKYIYETIDPADTKISRAGIPIAYNLEFMEPHPLGRAEWIKFVAAFTGDSELADSLFDAIEKNYLYYSTLAQEMQEKPVILDGASYKGVWYAAGGHSFPAQLYQDAGAIYCWEEDSSRGSIPMSIESVIETQHRADLWVVSTSANRDQLLAMESRYSLIDCFREGKTYHFGKRINRYGGLDYFESGVTRPDILLQDLISVIHPDLLPPEYNRVYLTSIQ